MNDPARQARARRRKDLRSRLSPKEIEIADHLEETFRGIERLGKKIEEVSARHKGQKRPDPPDLIEFRVKTNENLQQAEREREDFWRAIERRYGVIGPLSSLPPRRT